MRSLVPLFAEIPDAIYICPEEEWAARVLDQGDVPITSME
jgi:hypothetical protein